MPGKRKAVKRKRPAQGPQTRARAVPKKADNAGATPPPAEPEDVEQDEVVRLFADDDTEQDKSKGPNRFVDFEAILKSQVPSSILQQQQSLYDQLARQNDAANLEYLGCGGTDVAAHIPDTLCQKIWRNEFINLASLLKGGIELSSVYEAGGQLRINEFGALETRPRACTEKVPNLAKWTDAFIIFMSIYIRKFPDKTQELLKYMSNVRERAGRHTNFAWRTYDEQFRLTQVRNPKPWDKMDTELWLRVMPVDRGSVLDTTIESAQVSRPPAVRQPMCHDFNKGFCKWNPCRYLHHCTVCFSDSHAKWACPAATRTAPESSPPNSANRPAFRGHQWRGKPFGARGFKR